MCGFTLPPHAPLFLDRSANVDRPSLSALALELLCRFKPERFTTPPGLVRLSTPSFRFCTQPRLILFLLDLCQFSFVFFFVLVSFSIRIMSALPECLGTFLPGFGRPPSGPPVLLGPAASPAYFAPTEDVCPGVAAEALPLARQRSFSEAVALGALAMRGRVASFVRGVPSVGSLDNMDSTAAAVAEGDCGVQPPSPHTPGREASPLTWPVGPFSALWAPTGAPGGAAVADGCAVAALAPVCANAAAGPSMGSRRASFGGGAMVPLDSACFAPAHFGLPIGLRR